MSLRSIFSKNEQARPRTTLKIEDMSLLWPGERPQAQPAPGTWAVDLKLEEIVRSLTTNRRYMPFVRQILSTLITDDAVIAWRQAVLADFVNNPELVNVAENILPSLGNLKQGTHLLGTRRRNLLLETSDRLAELDLYTEIVQKLHTALAAADLQSTGLRLLRDSLNTLRQDANFQALCEELPVMRQPLENIVGLTIGVNLDAQMKPKSAVLLGINNQEFNDSRSMLERLIGSRTDERQETGIAPIHHLTPDPEQRIFDPLFQDLDKLLMAVAQPIARELDKYVRSSSSPLVRMEFELAFFVSAVRMMQRHPHIPFCRPEIATAHQRTTWIDQLHNIHLLLKTTATTRSVPSDVHFDDEGRIAILTGPNSGGKTTYLQSVGLAFVFFQAGLFIPAAQATMTPVDDILTHFPRLETSDQGRLAEEAERLRTIFQTATGQSLVLLNETFSSTASGEALYLAQDILCALRSIGVRAIYATHFVELVEHIPEVHATLEGPSNLCSLVAGVELTDDGSAHPTFTIRRGQPLGRSFAQEIARRHGISLEQILMKRHNT